LRSLTAIQKDAGLFCGSLSRKGEVFAYVGRNLDDLKDGDTGMQPMWRSVSVNLSAQPPCRPPREGQMSRGVTPLVHTKLRSFIRDSLRSSLFRRLASHTVLLPYQPFLVRSDSCLSTPFEGVLRQSNAPALHAHVLGRGLIAAPHRPTPPLPRPPLPRLSSP
jgi:hypothetical protein